MLHEERTRRQVKGAHTVLRISSGILSPVSLYDQLRQGCASLGADQAGRAGRKGRQQREETISSREGFTELAPAVYMSPRVRLNSLDTNASKMAAGACLV